MQKWQVTTESIEDTQEVSLDSIRSQGIKQVEMSREEGALVLRKTEH